MVETPRRHRPLLGISGFTLFLCLFLPALKVCNHAEVPVTVPFVWPPYLFGLVFGFAAILGREHLRVAVGIVRTLTYLFVAASVVLLVFTPFGGAIELLVSLGVAASLGKGTREPRLALTALVAGCIGVAWTGLLETDTREVMYGTHIALAASIGMIVAGLIWRREALDDLVPRVPRAIAL